MLANSLSPCIITAKVEESRDFYVKHFGAKITFDCGWYVNLEFGRGASLSVHSASTRSARLQSRWLDLQLQRL